MANPDGTHRLAGVLREAGRAGTAGPPGSKKTGASVASMLADVHLPARPDTNPPFSKLSLICRTTSCAGRIGECHICAVDNLTCVCTLDDAFFGASLRHFPCRPCAQGRFAGGRAFADRIGTPSGQPPSLGGNR